MRKYDDPRLVDLAELVAAGEATHAERPDAYDELVAAGRKVRAATRSAGGHAVEVLVDLFATARSGAISDVSDDVEKLTGRAPRSVLQYAQDHREASLS